MKARFLIIPLLLLAACQPVEDIVPVDNNEGRTPENGKYLLTINATLDTQTKALELINNDGTLDTYWVSGEKVSVYVGDEYKGYLTAAPTAEKSKTATLSGQIEGISQGATLTLLFPGREDKKWEYTGQTGAAPTPTGDMSKLFDYALATVTVNTVDGNTIHTTNADFTSQQSIYRFGFKSGGNALSVRSFVVSSAGDRIIREMTLGGTATPGSLTVTPASSTNNPLYVAIRNSGTAEDTYNFLITGEDYMLYKATKTIPAGALDAPKFISAKGLAATPSDFGPADGEISSSSAVL